MENNSLGDKINEILNNPEAMGQISNMLSQSDSQNADIDMARKFSEIAAKSKSDPKINLLYALRPYMNTERTKQIDNAIKMIKLTKITELFKDL